MSHFRFHFIVFGLALMGLSTSSASGRGWAPYSGLNIVDNSPQKFSSNSHDQLKDGSFYYEYPSYVGPKRSYHIASTDGISAVISYSRICRFLGHQDVVYFDEDFSNADEEMLWVEENLLTLKTHRRYIRTLICK